MLSKGNPTKSVVTTLLTVSLKDSCWDERYQQLAKNGENSLFRLGGKLGKNGPIRQIDSR
jgi:hypothetical protein